MQSPSSSVVVTTDDNNNNIPHLRKISLLIHIAKFACNTPKRIAVFASVSPTWSETIREYAMPKHGLLVPTSELMVSLGKLNKFFCRCLLHLDESWTPRWLIHKFYAEENNHLEIVTGPRGTPLQRSKFHGVYYGHLRETILHLAARNKKNPEVVQGLCAYFKEVVEAKTRAKREEYRREGDKGRFMHMPGKTLAPYPPAFDKKRRTPIQVAALHNNLAAVKAFTELELFIAKNDYECVIEDAWWQKNVNVINWQFMEFVFSCLEAASRIENPEVEGSGVEIFEYFIHQVPQARSFIGYFMSNVQRRPKFSRPYIPGLFPASAAPTLRNPTMYWFRDDFLANAAEYGNVELLKFLLETVSDRNNNNNDDKTFFESSRQEIFEMEILRQNNINNNNNNNHNFEEIRSFDDFMENQSFVPSTPIPFFFSLHAQKYAAGNRVNRQSADLHDEKKSARFWGRPPLMAAICSNKENAIEYLLSRSVFLQENEKRNDGIKNILGFHNSFEAEFCPAVSSSLSTSPTYDSHAHNLSSSYLHDQTCGRNPKEGEKVYNFTPLEMAAYKNNNNNNNISKTMQLILDLALEFNVKFECSFRHAQPSHAGDNLKAHVLKSLYPFALHGDTALHLAIRANNFASVELLLTHPGSPFVQRNSSFLVNVWGNSPLHVALMTDVGSKLQGAGADSNSTSMLKIMKLVSQKFHNPEQTRKSCNSCLQTAFDLTKTEGFKQLHSEEHANKCVALLRVINFDVPATIEAFKYTMIWRAEKCHTFHIQYMVHSNEKLKELVRTEKFTFSQRSERKPLGDDDISSTPLTMLEYAVYRGCFGLVKVLVEVGNISPFSYSSTSPIPCAGSNILHIAADVGFTKIIKYLLNLFSIQPQQSNAFIAMMATKNSAGETPVDIAIKQYNEAKSKGGDCRHLIEMRREIVEMLGGEL